MKLSDCFSGENFVINSFLLKKIQSYNLSFDEFILFLYFLNSNKPTFEPEKIKISTNLGLNNILDAFNNLIEKNIVSLVTKKNDSGMIEEIISLDGFYNKIEEDLNKESAPNEIDEIYDYMCKELDMKLDETEKAIISAWFDLGYTTLSIKDAVKEAKYNGVSNLRYIDKVLYEWKNRGIDSLDDAKQYLKDKDEFTNTRELFDYNWLDDEN